MHCRVVYIQVFLVDGSNKNAILWFTEEKTTLSLMKDLIIDDILKKQAINKFNFKA